MNKKTTLLGMILICAFSAVSIFSQDVKPVKSDKKKKNLPNLSGTWVLDVDRSFKIEELVYKKQATPADPARRVTHFLVIEHTDPEFKMTVKRRVEDLDPSGKVVKTEEIVHTERTFYTDKRGESNNYYGKKTYRSVTTQRGREVFVSMIIEKGKNDILTFELSKDGGEIMYRDLGYKVDPDFTGNASFYSPSALYSTKYYVRAGK